MTVTDVTKDLDALSMTFTSHFDATPEQVWRLWADPRLLERWWGPPEYPATVEQHDLSVGGHVTYFMTSPEGERYPGGFRVTEVSPPTRLGFEDYFAGEDGQPDESMPISTTQVDITARPEGGTVMTIGMTASSREAMEQLLAMGADEGMHLALGQIDALLVEIG